MRSLFFLFLFLFVSCGKSTEQKREEAITSAEILLSKKSCQAAVDVLEGVGRDGLNARYMQTLASAYACKAGYSEPTFFADDLPLIGSPSPFGGLTRFSIASTMGTPDADSFTALQTAIDLLLYSGGISATLEPTVARREAAFTASEAGDIHAQLMYMILTQMGLYLRYYGDSSSTGVKGSGPGSNVCLANYSNVAITFNDVASNLTAYFGAGLTGACNGLNKGHAQLGAQGSLNVARMCQGVVLLNNFIAILPRVIASITNDELNTVSALSTVLNTAVSQLSTLKSTTNMDNLKTVLNQANCEALNATEELEVYFAVMYEVLFQ